MWCRKLLYRSRHHLRARVSFRLFRMYSVELVHESIQSLAEPTRTGCAHVAGLHLYTIAHTNSGRK